MSSFMICTTIRDSLKKNKGSVLTTGTLYDLIRNAETFGFHLATMDIRQHKRIHSSAIQEIVQQRTVPYNTFSDAERAAWLTDAVEGSSPLTVDESLLSPASHEVLDTFRTIKRSIDEMDCR